jgi:GntR family transcriptional regulator/MocR family aminotransferase
MRRPESSAQAVAVPVARGEELSLRRQIERAVRLAVRERRLPPGAALPSSRALAGDLGVSRGVVVEAYEELIAEGVLAARRGSATRVAEASPRGGEEG